MKVQSFFSASMLIAIFAVVSGWVTPEATVKISEKVSDVIYDKSFPTFLSHFENTPLPYSLTLAELQMKNSKYPSKLKFQKSISTKSVKRTNPAIARTDFIPEISTGRFGRMGPPTIEPVVRFSPTENTIAVVYTVQHRYGGDYKTYNMVIYDTKGNMVFPVKEKGNNRVYAGFQIGAVQPKQTVTCQIDTEGLIWKNFYKNEWEKDVKKTDYSKNEIAEYHLDDTQVFKINKKGIAEQLSEYPVATRASLK